MEAAAKQAGFTGEEAGQIIGAFRGFDADGSGAIDSKELYKALKELGENPSPSEVAAQIKEVDADNSGQIEFNEFLVVVKNVRKGKASAFGRTVEKRGDISINVLKGKHATHAFSDEEKQSFAEYINDVLKNDPDVAHVMPLDPADMSLFPACSDGILLCKLVNDAVPGTIDERVINKAKKSGKGGVLSPRGGAGGLNVHQSVENLNLAVNSCKAIGCTVVNVGASDIQECREHVILGLIWQIIRIGLLAQINLQEHPELYKLLEPGEDISKLMKLPPDQILLRWLNYHLKAAGDPRRVKNFAGDIKDSHVYTVVMNQIAPKAAGVDKKPLQERDPHQRAELMLQNAAKIDCRRFVKPKDVVDGNSKLNLAFVANMFNMCPGLGELTEDEKGDMGDVDFSDEGTREERAFKMWINSLGIDPYVNDLYDDLRDGLVILRIMDAIRPGVVNWKRVNQKAPLSKFKAVENGNYACDLAKEPFHFSVPSTQGSNIYDGDKMRILGIIWQLMREHVLSLLRSLGNVQEKEIIAWCNQTITTDRKMTSFKDKSLSNSLYFIDLLNSIRPDCIPADLVTPGESEDDARLNAQLVISTVRKLGGVVFLDWMDIVEVKPKLILTLAASAMLLGQQQ